MPKKIVCDFCLTEFQSFFHKPEKLADEHYICKSCKKILKEYNLPIKYDLFQILILAEPKMRNMIITDYVSRNRPEDILAKFFPMPNVLLHEGEHCANQRNVKIRVQKDLIPADQAIQSITDIRRKHISNLPDANENAEEISGKLFQTEVALYFISEHFINCHRLANIVHNKDNLNEIVVMENGKKYTYQTEYTDLFFLREQLFQLTLAAKANKKSNLIYLSSDNTMTITPGIYSVPKNIKPGSYYVSSLNDKGMSIKDAAGRIYECTEGRIHLDEGTQLEVTGEFQFRLHQKEEIDKK